MSTNLLPIRMLPRRPILRPILPENTTVETGRSTRPLWFDGRFLAAHDLKREQHYFLRRQANLGRAAGSGVLHGLTVTQAAANGQTDSAETIVIGAGVGLTPSGALVMIPADLTIVLSDLADALNLDEQFGLDETPQQPARTRTGVYIVALRPVEFTANPTASYPANLQTPRVVQDGDIVEATAVSLVPFRNPVNNFDTALQRAALARQIFVTGPPPMLSDSVLPLAMIGLDRNEIQWIDMYLVRRDSGPETNGLRLGLADPATAQAYMMQYDAQLQANPLNSAASDNFQALPAVGRFPLAGIDTASLTQTFFPQQMAVELSIIPADELPAVIEDSMSLPPIDLLQPATSFANFAVFALIAVPRNSFAGLLKTLPPTPLKPALAQGVGRLPILRPVIGPIRPLLPIPTLGSTSSSAWAAAMAGQTYGFYVVRRSEPIYVELTNPAPAATTTPAPTPTGS